MLSRKDPADVERGGGELNTIVGRGSVFEGKITVQSSVRIDGKVHGTVEVSDSLIVGKDGEIDGEVHVRNAVIGGKVSNKIIASGKVVLEAKSVVQGEVRTSRLVIDEGAIFEGKCIMSEHQKLAAATGHADSGRSLGIGVASRHEMAASR